MWSQDDLVFIGARKRERAVSEKIHEFSLRKPIPEI